VNDSTIAAITFAISAIAALWKVFSLIANLETKIKDAEHEIEKLELTVNGVRERMEHINSRLVTIQRDQERTIDELGGWLTKNTSFEPRNRG
jgi:predicted  nucleic acid-binding Zn-ribbon protein